MTERSLYQDTAPTLGWWAFPAAAAIVHGSYLTTTLPSAAAVGARMFVPAGSALIGVTATLMVYATEVTDFFDIAYGGALPAGSGQIALAEGWNAVTFEQVPLTAGGRFTVAAAYTGAGLGVHTGSEDPAPIQAVDGTPLFLSGWSTATPVVDRSFVAHTYDTGGQTALGVEWSFADHGLDVTVEDTYIAPDTTGPVLTVTAQPETATTARTATFTVTTNEPTTTTYALDGAAAVAFTGTAALTDLALGAHTIVLTATDPSGNSTSTSITWVVISSSGTSGDLLVSPEYVGRKLGKPTLTDAERETITDAIVDAQADVEGYLRRPLTSTEVTLTGLYPRAGHPVTSWKAWPWEDYDDEVTVRSATVQPDGTYTVVLGIGLDAAAIPPIVRYIRAASIETLRADPDSGMGTREVTSLSAEGQSVSYAKRSSTDTGAAGAIPRIDSLRPWRRYSTGTVFKPSRPLAAPWPMSAVPIGWDPR